MIFELILYNLAHKSYSLFSNDMQKHIKVMWVRWWQTARNDHIITFVFILLNYKGSTISRNGTDRIGPNSHTILRNGPDKLKVTWGAQLLSIIQATVVVLSPWHPTVTILPKPFTIRTQWQRIVFIVCISWHGCGI